MTVEFTGELKKLEGEGTTGDFVLNNQELAKDEGFGHVSKLWYDKTISIEDALQVLSEGRESQKDVKVPHNKLAPFYDEETGEVGLEDWNTETRFKLTEHAWGQYAKFLDLPTTFPKYYINNGQDAEDSKTFYNVLVNASRNQPERNFLIRTYNDDTCRAVLSSKYGRIDNRWFLETLGELIPGGRVSHHKYNTPDTLRFNFLIPDTIRQEDDSDYGGMVSVTNCEIGKLANSGMPSLFRAICMNGCIWDETRGVSWRQVHKGKIETDLLTKMMVECIQAQIPLMDKIIADFMLSREWQLGQTELWQVFTQIAIDNSLNGKQVKMFTEAYKEEPNPNGFGIINAMTRFGQSQNADLWNSMDMTAGKLLAGGKPSWDRLISRAKSIREEESEKVMRKVARENSVFSLVAV